jgi:hypothetical protein
MIKYICRLGNLAPPLFQFSQVLIILNTFSEWHLSESLLVVSENCRRTEESLLLEHCYVGGEAFLCLIEKF